MNIEDNNMKLEQEDIINVKKRGEILYYTITQVATLLEQEESNILYFTHVFDDILNIKISDKKLIYTDKNIDKLEFLINLKNKGLTIKEIQKYCDGLSFDSGSLLAPKDDTTISVNEMAETISKSQSEQFDNLKEYLGNKIEANNELISQNIVNLMEEEHKKQFKLLKEDILNEISSKFDGQNNTDGSLSNEISTKIDKLITEKLSLEDNIKSEFEKLNEMDISMEKKIIAEIKKYYTVMFQTYCGEHELEKKKGKSHFLSTIFTTNDNK
ncbi:MerR family transcriptional regulator [Clostridium akagii]|uniref:MerR family transcriptional regulator n=1 Tax=Clostridium akagii TaxID=91623 RepID=UPI00047AD943|nr:MerR family transcriptional regulator [Clostridium akagii]